jgi:hypothetical protein
MANQITRLNNKLPAAVQEGMELDDTRYAIQAAGAKYQRKLRSLEAEFQQRADVLTLEYKAELAGITGGTEE